MSPRALLLTVLAAACTPAADDVPTDDDTGADETGGVTDDTADTGDTGGGDTGDTAGPNDLPPWPDPFPDVLPGAFSGDFGLPGFVGDAGARITTIVPDGDGGLYLAGSFDHVGTMPALGIVHHDGVDVAPMGDGLPGMVRDVLVLDDGTVLAASQSSGFLGISYALSVYDDDTETWSDVSFGPDGPIRALRALPDGTVMVGGGFTTIGGIASAGLAVFDPDALEDAWLSVPAFDAQHGGTVYGFADRAGYDLCIVGLFDQVGGVSVDNIACVDDGTWSAWGSGLNGAVNGVEVSGDGRTMAYGYFSFLDGDTGAYAIGLAAYDDQSDTWEWPDEGGVDGGLVIVVRDMLPTDTGYIVVGEFSGSGVGGSGPVRTTPSIAEFDGTTWQAISGGLRSTMGPVVGDVAGGYVVLEDDDGDLHVGGHLQRAVTGATASGWFVHDGTDWTAPFGGGPAAPVGGNSEAVAVARDHTVFLLATNAETEGFQRLLTYDQGAWVLDPTSPEGPTTALWGDANGLVRAAGELYLPGTTGSCGVARYEASAWSCEVPGGGEIRKLVEMPNGDLLLVGAFDAGQGRLNIARWDGTALHAVGGGIGDDTTKLIDAAVSPSGDIYVRGSGIWFGRELAQVAYYDAVSGRWGAMPLRGSVYAMFWWDGAMMFGGNYMRPTTEGYMGGDLPFMSWDGAAFTEWTVPLTGWGGGAPSIYFAAPWQDGLFVGGTIQGIGEDAAHDLVWFDGTDWHDLGGGVDDLVTDMAPGPDGIWFSGTMRQAGGAPSFGVAKWVHAAP